MSSDEEDVQERVNELFKQCLQRHRKSYPNSPIDFNKMNLTSRVKQQRSSIGRGHFSTVFKGKLDGQKLIAVKLLRLPSYHKEQERLYETVLLRFFREFTYWAALNHTHVANLLGFTLADGNIGFVSDWYSNGNVVEYLKRDTNGSKPNLILDIAEGLRYLHGCISALIHGDLKGVNILVDKHGIARIGDFGISKQISDLNRTTGFTTTSGVAGTTPWMSPELFTNPIVTLQSDIYAFGGVLIEVLCPGKIPYGYKPSEHLIMLAKIQNEHLLRNEYPEFNGQDWLWSIVTECLAFKPEDRPSIAPIIGTMYKMFKLVPRAAGSTAHRQLMSGVEPDANSLLKAHLLLNPPGTGVSPHGTSAHLLSPPNGQGRIAVALYDCEAQEENEISFKKYDKIINVNTSIDEGWWFGKAKTGEEGIFPANYVKLWPNSPHKGQVGVALYDYDAQEENDISFRKDDKILNIDVHGSDDWWEGETQTGAIGLFPANYIKLQ